jgi:hypothetical protein
MYVDNAKRNSREMIQDNHEESHPPLPAPGRQVEINFWISYA